MQAIRFFAGIFTQATQAGTCTGMSPNRPGPMGEMLNGIRDMLHLSDAARRHMGRPRCHHVRPHGPHHHSRQNGPQNNDRVQGLGREISALQKQLAQYQASGSSDDIATTQRLIAQDRLKQQLVSMGMPEEMGQLS
jgi:hypothetical protein